MIGDLLHDPHLLLDWLPGWANAHVRQLTFAPSVAAITLELLHVLVVRLRRRAATNGARCVEIFAPPRADMVAACAGTWWMRAYLWRVRPARRPDRRSG